MPESQAAKTLAGKVVVVTGGARGIGQATVRALIDQGARVGFCARHPDHVQRALRDLAAPDRLFGAVADVADVDQVREFERGVTKVLGPIDVLVNNAGILHYGEFADESYENIGRIVDVNLKGTMFMTRAVLPAMVKRGAGTIVNVASGVGLYAVGGLAAYSATKFAVVGFTQALDQEVADAGIRVYAVCPGRVATDMQVQFSGARVGMAPETVAARIAQLAGPHPKAKTGTCVELYEPG
jgi:3-oxoacyl-[acyl-carrier protein] reductase